MWTVVRGCKAGAWAKLAIAGSTTGFKTGADCSGGPLPPAVGGSPCSTSFSAFTSCPFEVSGASATSSFYFYTNDLLFGFSLKNKGPASVIGLITPT